MKRLILLIAAGCLSLDVSAQTLPTPIKQGMPYGKARKALIKAGWQTTPRHTLPNGTPVCYIHAERGMDATHEKGACDFIEVSSCAGSGMGFCDMQFTDGRGSYLHITTVDGPPPHDANIYRWHVDKKPTQPEPVSLN